MSEIRSAPVIFSISASVSYSSQRIRLETRLPITVLPLPLAPTRKTTREGTSEHREFMRTCVLGGVAGMPEAALLLVGVTMRACGD